MLAFCSVSLSCKRSRLGSCLTKGTARSLASRGSKESYVVLNHFSAGVELAMTVWASNTTRWADCRLEFHSAVQKALKDVLLRHILVPVSLLELSSVRFFRHTQILFADFLLARTQPSYSSRLFPALGLYWELSRNCANADNKS